MSQQDDRFQEERGGDEGDLSTADLVGTQENQEERRPDRNEPGRQDGPEPLFPSDEAEDLRSRWDSIQAGFVDEPRRAVEEADKLVATAMKRLAESFANERHALEAQWDRGNDVSTEDLRQALRRYRSFFGRLLSM
jgi:hypothetical protein